MSDYMLYAPEEIEQDGYRDNPSDAGPHIIMCWPKEKIRQFGGVIVQCWDHKDYGRGKRMWLSEFDGTEREKAGKLYRKLYDWEMRRGYPQTIQFSFKTYKLLNRLGNFFASI